MEDFGKWSAVKNDLFLSQNSVCLIFPYGATKIDLLRLIALSFFIGCLSKE